MVTITSFFIYNFYRITSFATNVNYPRFMWFPNSLFWLLMTQELWYTIIDITSLLYFLTVAAGVEPAHRVDALSSTLGLPIIPYKQLPHITFIRRRD